MGAVIGNGAKCVTPTCECAADPFLIDGTFVHISGGADRVPSWPLIHVTATTPIVLRGALVVVIHNAPVAGRYILVDAQSGGYTGRFSSVELRFQTNQRATFTCFATNVAFDPGVVAADVTIPTDNCAGGGMPWWIWVVVGVVAALLLILLIVVIVVVSRRRQRRMHQAAAAEGNIAFSARSNNTPYSPLEEVPLHVEDETVNFTTGGTKLERPQQGDMFNFVASEIANDFGSEFGSEFATTNNGRVIRPVTQTNITESYTTSWQ